MPMSIVRGAGAAILFGFAVAFAAAGSAGAQKLGEERLYITTEGLYLQRFASDGLEWAFDDMATATTPADDRAVADSGDIIESWNPGARLLVGLVVGDGWAVEGGGFWLQPYTGEKTLIEDPAGSELRLFADTSTSEFDGANTAVGKYGSRIWGAQGSLRYDYNGNVDWIGGLRYIRLVEDMSLNFEDNGNGDFGAYRIESRNELFGLQGGFAGSMPVAENVSVAVRGLMGVLANRIETSQIVVDNIGPAAPGAVLRYQDDRGFTTTFMADIGLGVELALTKAIVFGIGYQALFLSNVALAPDQAAIGSARVPARGPDSDGRVLYHGGRAYISLRM